HPNDHASTRPGIEAASAAAEFRLAVRGERRAARVVFPDVWLAVHPRAGTRCLLPAADGGRRRRGRATTNACDQCARFRTDFHGGRATETRGTGRLVAGAG